MIKFLRKFRFGWDVDCLKYAYYQSTTVLDPCGFCDKSNESLISWQLIIFRYYYSWFSLCTIKTYSDKLRNYFRRFKLNQD